MNTHNDTNATGYYLHEINYDWWEFGQKDDQDPADGPFKSVVTYAAKYTPVKLSEIELGIKDMIQKGNNCIHFGIQGKFLYSFNKELDSEREAS